MSTLEKVLITMLGLIAIYLFLANAGAANAIFTSLGKVGIATFGVLQGRDVSGLGGVNISTPLGGQIGQVGGI
jgi:hypothetical protein